MNSKGLDTGIEISFSDQESMKFFVRKSRTFKANFNIKEINKRLSDKFGAVLTLFEYFSSINEQGSVEFLGRNDSPFDCLFGTERESFYTISTDYTIKKMYSDAFFIYYFEYLNKQDIDLEEELGKYITEMFTAILEKFFLLF